MNQQAPYHIGELIALAIVSAFCLGITVMIAIGVGNYADHMDELERTTIIQKNIQPIHSMGIGRKEEI